MWIILSLWRDFGLSALGHRVYEWLSFRRRGALEETTVVMIGKDRSKGRRTTTYNVAVVSPVDERAVEIQVQQRTFDKVWPLHECAVILVERAPNGAARLVRPTRWKLPCPSASA